MLTPPIPARPQPLNKDPLPTRIPTYREASDKDGLNAFLRRGFENDCGRSNGEPFVVWTEKWVYFSAEYSHCGCQWVEALPRDPTAEIEPIHVGG